jgi:hypothetical protein
MPLGLHRALRDAPPFRQAVWDVLRTSQVKNGQPEARGDDAAALVHCIGAACWAPFAMRVHAQLSMWLPSYLRTTTTRATR